MAGSYDSLCSSVLLLFFENVPSDDKELLGAETIGTPDDFRVLIEKEPFTQEDYFQCKPFRKAVLYADNHDEYLECLRAVKETGVTNYGQDHMWIAATGYYSWLYYRIRADEDQLIAQISYFIEHRDEPSQFKEDILTIQDAERDETQTLKMGQNKILPGNTTFRDPGGQEVLIYPVKILHDVDTEAESVIIRYTPRRGRKINMEVPMDKLANHNLICLAKVGMPVNRNTHRELGELLYDLVLHNRGDNIPICYKVGHIGWVDETEVSEAGFIPYKSNALFSLQRNYHQEFEAIKSSGKLEDWVNLIKPYRDNEHEILRIVLAASFSSVLIRKLGALSYVLDLWSRSGLGKTVTLSVAASVWGKPSPDAGYIKSFNSTENAMEQAALFFCDLPFCVDEQQLVPRGRSLTTLIYRLCEGTPRGRATSFGGLNTQHGWRNCTIMTGESPVVNESDAAGMQNRVITVYSDRPLITDSKPEIHEFCQKLDCYYGTAGRSL